MSLKLISFVGVDKETDLFALDGIERRKSPELEFSVLYSEGRSSGRYSTLEFCRKFLPRPSAGYKRSLHLCGKPIIEKFIAGDFEVLDLCLMASRVQLNFAMRKHDSDELLESVMAAMDLGIVVILQLNKSKADFVARVKNTLDAQRRANLSLLHDSSGGFGRVIKKVSPPDEKFFTGYAGGIKPENAKRILQLIDQANPDGIPFYIDMESGVRTGGVFDLEKVRAVISAVVPKKENNGS